MHVSLRFAIYRPVCMLKYYYIVNYISKSGLIMIKSLMILSTLAFFFVGLSASTSFAAPPSIETKRKFFSSIPYLSFKECSDQKEVTNAECEDLKTFVYFELRRAAVLVKWNVIDEYFYSDFDSSMNKDLSDYTGSNRYVDIKGDGSAIHFNTAMKKNVFRSVSDCFLHKCKFFQNDPSVDLSSVFSDLFSIIDCVNLSVNKIDKTSPINKRIYFTSNNIYLLPLCERVHANDLSISIAFQFAPIPGSF